LGRQQRSAAEEDHVYRSPALTVDAVIREPQRGVLLIRRGHPPFAGCWALPGGFVDYGESCPQACVREVHEETGLEVEVVRLLDVLSEPHRDPRQHVVSVVYECRVIGGQLASGDDAADARWFTATDGIDLAFDHCQVLEGLAL
jgi:8-oxo-dGTP diphosphatase